MLLGILVALSPFSGLPLAILSWILPVLGLAVLAIGITTESRNLKLQRARSSTLSQPL